MCGRLAAAEKGPFSNVPRTRWSYLALIRLDRQGLFTGYSQSTLAGTRVLTRYEFTVALQRMLQQLHWCAGAGDARRDPASLAQGDEMQLRWAVVRKLGPASEPHPADDLLRLAREFRPELVMVGVDTRVLMRNLEQLASPPWNSVVPPRREKESPWHRQGAQEARDDWERGTAVLYAGGGFAPTPEVDPVLGIPCRSRGGCLRDVGQDERIVGYNEELYRLALERGLPANSQRQPVERQHDRAGGK